VAISRARGAISDPIAGLDLRPVRDAGLAVRAGNPIYGVPQFVYLPPAAVLGVLLTFVSLHTDVVVYAYLEVAIVAGTVFLLRAGLGRSRWTLLGAAAIAAALLEGDLVMRDARLENVSVLLVLPCLGVIYCWGTGRWRGGAMILAATLLVKPLLIALVIVPLLARRWTATALTIAVTALLGLMSLPLVKNLSAAGKVAGNVLRGSSLTGGMAVYNLSIWGWGQVHHVPSGLVLSARFLVVAVAVGCGVVFWRRRPPVTVATVGPLAGVLLGATFLAGSLSENHYVLVLLPVAFSCLRAGSVVTRSLIVGAGLLAAYSSQYATFLGSSLPAVQTRFVVIELLVFVGSVIAVVHSDAFAPALINSRLGGDLVLLDPEVRRRPIPAHATDKGAK